MQEKIDDTRQLCRQYLEQANNPALLWSGGKESQLLLWLLRELMPEIPVIHLRPLSHPTKHQFADRMIEEVRLRRINIPLAGVDVVGKGNEINLVAIYAVNETFRLFLPFENGPGRPIDDQSNCAVEVINEKSRKIADGIQLPNPPPDTLFIGHRSEDGDLIFGNVPVKEFAHTEFGVAMVYPLKDWALGDVWEASRLLSVPQNEARYAGEMSANADYFPLCTKCFERGPEQVPCPKINDYVDNLGNKLNLEDRREQWRQTFVNIERANGQYIKN